MKFKVLIIFVIILFWNLNGYTTVYDVYKGGPYTNLNGVFTTDGDTIHIIDNARYNEFYDIQDNYLTIMGDADNKPEIYCDGDVLNIGATNVVLKNLKISIGTSATGSTALTILSNNIKISNCDFYVYGNLFDYTAIKIRKGRNILIEDCTFSGNHFTAIYITNMTGNIKIKDSLFFNLDNGIVLKKVDSDADVEKLEIINNIFHNISSNAIYETNINPITNILLYNLIYNCADYGIKMYGNSYSYIYNNTIAKGGGGLFLKVANSNEWYLYNNIFYYNDIYYDFYFDNNGMSPIFELRNNCINSRAIAGGMTVDENNINIDPLFVNMDNYDFHLRGDSPCVDSGLYIDYQNEFGFSPPIYNGVIDRGALEFFPVEESVKNNNANVRVELAANNLINGMPLLIRVSNLDKISSSDKVHLEASVYSITGKKVKDLFNANVNTSASLDIKWNNNKKVKSGLYLLYVKINDKSYIKKFFIMR